MGGVRLKHLFQLAGKSQRSIVAIFAASSEAYRRAIDHVQAGGVDLPIWLLASIPVEAAECSRVIVVGPGFRGLLRALRVLWPEWAALSVVTFTGEPRYGWLKLAPFLVPPWKVLVMNEHNDFCNAWPTGLARHLIWRLRRLNRRSRDAVATYAVRARDLLLGLFWKLVWTLLDPLLERTSAPWRRPPAQLTLQPEESVCRERGVLACVTNRAVDRHALDRALRKLELPYEIREGLPPVKTRYQYILVVEETPVDDLQQLMRLFDRPDTFAARCQHGRSGFQKDILPRAAFRALQPGEVTQVAAPVPRVMLLDAGKLARIGGLPPASSRQCRWLLLFWKAAALGWKSYGVGTRWPHVTMIPDRAFPEAEFCFHLLKARPQLAPPPASFDGVRGTVCFHPAFERPSRSRTRRILMVSPYLPYPLSHGGAVRMFHLARRLSERYDLILVTFREREDYVDYAKLSRCFSRVLVVDHGELRQKDESVPEAVVDSRSRAMSAAIREAAETHSPDLLQVEYTQMAEYRQAAPEVPAVLVEHDVTFSLHEQLVQQSGGRRAAEAHARAQQELERWYRFESHWLQQYDAAAVMSEDERLKAIQAGAGPERVWVVPNGVDVERFHPAPAQAESTEILYVGSFRHLPNILGFDFLRRQILPGLWKRMPDVRVRVVAGPDHEVHWRRFAGGGEALARLDPRITVEGFVEDLAPYYARARAVVVPLVASAGTNIKVLEALACGKAVVSTPIGCAGLSLEEGEEILVAPDAGTFRDSLEQVLADAVFRGRLGGRARRAAVQRHSWERAAERAIEMYECLWAAQPCDQISSFQVARSSPL